MPAYALALVPFMDFGHQKAKYLLSNEELGEFELHSNFGGSQGRWQDSSQPFVDLVHCLLWGDTHQADLLLLVYLNSFLKPPIKITST